MTDTDYDEPIIPAPLRAWAEAFTDEVRAGTVDLLEIVNCACEQMEGEAYVCPLCGVRFAYPDTTAGRIGTCATCHLKRLAAIMRERKGEEEAHREYQAEKKAASRRVACVECGFEFSPRSESQPRSSDRRVCPACRVTHGRASNPGPSGDAECPEPRGAQSASKCQRKADAGHV